MAGKKAKFALTDFFNNLFNNFGKIVFTNLLFAVPLAVLVTAFYFLDSALKLNGYFILMLSIIPLSPFFCRRNPCYHKTCKRKRKCGCFQNIY